MSRNTQIATAVVNAQADLLARQLDDGWLRIYNGSQPPNADAALTDQVLLLELRFAEISAPAALNGVLQFELDPAIVSTAGTATWCRASSEAGATVFDGSVGVADDLPNLVLSTVDLVLGASVTPGLFTHTVSKAAPGI